MNTISKNSQEAQENLRRQQILKLSGYNVPQDGSWGPYQQKLWDQLGYKQPEFNADTRSEGQKFWQPVHNYFAEAAHKIKNPEEGPLMGKHTLPAIGVAAGLGLAGSGAASTLAGMKAAAGFSTRKALGDMFMGMLAGTAANEGVSAATGKTIGQNIASATNDYVPAFVGEFANPFYATGWWSKPVGNLIKGSADFANATKVYLSNLTGLSKVKSPKNLPQINFKIDRNSEYYKNLVNQFGDLQANRIVQRLESPEFKKYFLAGNEDQALKEIYDYSLARSVDNKIRGIPDEGGGVLTGSSAIATEGTIHRKSAVPHDLDYIMYTKSPKKDVYQGTKEETKEALQELFGNYKESILQSPGMLKFRQQFGLEDAPVFNIPRWLPRWFVPRDKTGAIYLTPMFNVGEAGVNRTVQSTVNGIPIDLFFTGNHIPTGPIKGVSAASTPLYWKKQWSKTPSKRNDKDITDLQDYKPYSSDNPIINPITGESQYAPFYFGDDLISAEGYPNVNMIELYPGASQQVPATMNWKGNFKVMPKGTRGGNMPKIDFVDYLSQQTGRTIKRVPIKKTKHGDIYNEGFAFVDNEGKEIAHIAGDRDAGKNVWVGSSFVAPEFRHRGLGKQMYFDFNDHVFNTYGTTLHSSPYQRVGSTGAGMSPSNRLWKSLREKGFSSIEGNGLNKYDVMAEPSKIPAAYRAAKIEEYKKTY